MIHSFPLELVQIKPQELALVTGHASRHVHLLHRLVKLEPLVVISGPSSLSLELVTTS